MESRTRSTAPALILCLARLTEAGLRAMSDKIRFLVLSRYALGAAVLSLFVIGVETTARAEVIVTPIGAPTFVLTDFNLFAAPIGTAASGYAEFLQTAQAILPPPNHLFSLPTGIVPGDPHAGPYDNEINQGVAVNGFIESTTFTTAQFSNGTGVFLAFMITAGPDSPTGSSPDFPSGPIIPNTIFPISIAAQTFTNGVFNDDSGEFKVPAIAGVEGYSHFPYFLADNFDFTELDIPGDYEYRISVLDEQGNGYQIVVPFQIVPFQVVPEPSSWMMLVTACLILTGLTYYRRQSPQ
jgi:hypothetical protein